MYHGTSGDFDKFKDGQITWTTPNSGLAGEYAGIDRATDSARDSGINIMPLEVDIQTPLNIRHVGLRRTARDFAYEVLQDKEVVKRIKAMPEAEQDKVLDAIDKLDNDNLTELWRLWDKDKELIQVFKDMGFDGIVTQEGGMKTYGAFNPTQLKSKFNKGTYDRTNSNILKGAGFVGAGLTAKQQIENKDI